MTGETRSSPSGTAGTILDSLGVGDGWIRATCARFEASADRLPAGQATMARELNPPVASGTAGTPGTERTVVAGDRTDGGQ
jgi:hypothetical protein